VEFGSTKTYFTIVLSRYLKQINAMKKHEFDIDDLVQKNGAYAVYMEGLTQQTVK
jgi:hypothetical protein